MTDSNELFTIKNLVCSYDGVFPVLYVPDLKIYAGEITIILGRSGSGKSTLLETLGLMTESIAKYKEPYLKLDELEDHTPANMLTQSNAKLAFYGDSELGEVDYFNKAIEAMPSWANNRKNKNNMSIWGGSEKFKRHAMRLRHFAFLFQSTNLMDNFTTEENVAIAEMCSVGLSNSTRDIEDCCRKKARETLGKIDLKDNQFESKVKELSGGEKQRVAFARAMNTEFSVVFGDEPTGNLDEENSTNLMEIFQNTLKESEGNKSAIIVSHNIIQSLKFADKLILIDTQTYKRDDMVYMYGKIDDNVVYFSEDLDSNQQLDEVKKQWYKQKGDEPPVAKKPAEMKKILKETLLPKENNEK